MAKLKIGSGIQLKAEIPKLGNELPKIGSPDLLQKLQEMQAALTPSPTLDMNKLVQMVMEQLPKPEPKKDMVLHFKDVDLTPLNEMTANHEERICEMSEKIDELAVRMDEDRQELELPVVNQVTHVQDVSPEVMKKCKEMIRQAEVNVMLKVQDLQNQSNKQKKLIYALCGALVLTIFLHLI